MPERGKRRAARGPQLQQLLRVLNGEFGWSELKLYFLSRYATMVQLGHPELLGEGSNPIGHVTDADYKAGVELLGDTVQRWAAGWMTHPPRRKYYDPEAYFEDKKNAGIRNEFIKMVAELPKETVIELFVPGKPSEISASEPAEPGRWTRLAIKHPILPTGVRSGEWASLKAYANDVMASGHFAEPSLLAKAIAVELFRALLRSGIRLGRCRLDSCGRYFLNVSGVTQFCSRRHAQAAVNQKRSRGRDAAIARVTKAIKDYESEAKSNRDWKGFVARRAHVSRYWVTLLVNKSVIVPPGQDRKIRNNIL